jgi:hypothetical protein
MNSADFLVSSHIRGKITLDTRISLGYALGCFLHSLPAFFVFFLCVHIAESRTPLIVVNNL